ncbi:hypothetical protein [uncultured Helicobacter sp.]
MRVCESIESKSFLDSKLLNLEVNLLVDFKFVLDSVCGLLEHFRIY